MVLLQLFGNQALVESDLSGFRIDALEHGLVGCFARPQEFARAPVERPNDSRLSDCQQRLPRAIPHVDVHENLLEHMIEIPVVAGQKLVVPHDLAGIGVESQR